MLFYVILLLSMKMLLSGGKKAKEHLPWAIEQLDSPDVLLIPTACSTPKSYARKVDDYQDFFNRSGLNTEVLHTLGNRPSKTELQHKLGKASLVYVPGGHTPTLLEEWDKFGIKDQLETFVKEPGKIYAGASAGAIAVFSYGLVCPAKNTSTEDWDFEVREGTGLVRAYATVHADSVETTKTKPRVDYFANYGRHLIATMPGVSIDNHASLLIDGQKIKASYLDSMPDRTVIYTAGNPTTLDDVHWVDASEFTA